MVGEPASSQRSDLSISLALVTRIQPVPPLSVVGLLPSVCAPHPLFPSYNIDHPSLTIGIRTDAREYEVIAPGAFKDHGNGDAVIIESCGMTADLPRPTLFPVFRLGVRRPLTPMLSHS